MFLAVVAPAAWLATHAAHGDQAAPQQRRVSAVFHKPGPGVPFGRGTMTARRNVWRHVLLIHNTISEIKSKTFQKTNANLLGTDKTVPTHYVTMPCERVHRSMRNRWVASSSSAWALDFDAGALFHGLLGNDDVELSARELSGRRLEGHSGEDSGGCAHGSPGRPAAITAMVQNAGL